MHGPQTASVPSTGYPRPRIRVALLAVLACLGALALWGPSPAKAALPPQGVYDQCAPATDDCASHLQAIADAGFKYVLNYTAWYGSAAQVRQYADEAQSVGLQVIWPLNDHAWRDGTDLRSYYEYLGPDCHCSSNAEFKRWALGLVKDHPATWGFYVGDELDPTSTNISQTKALEAEVKSIAPEKPTMYVTIPNDGGELTSQLQPFADAADYVGADYYPVGKSNNIDATSNYAAQTRSLTTSAGSNPIFVLQAFSWRSYDAGARDVFPSRSAMQQMRDSAIGSGNPSILLWYAYNDVLRSSNPSGNWAAVKDAAFAPYVQVTGLGGKRCMQRLKAKVSVRANAAIRKVRANLDGRSVLKTSRENSRLPSMRLRGGRHVLRVTATDRQGKAAVHTLRFRICAQVS
jgi:hypothetical protein